MAGFVNSTVPFVDYSISFTTLPDATILDTGAIVHRFLGQPQTGSDTNGDTGVTYRDMPALGEPGGLCGPIGNVYGPRIADLNLFTNGFQRQIVVEVLTGVVAVVVVALVIDGLLVLLGRALMPWARGPRRHAVELASRSAKTPMPQGFGR